MPWADVAAGAHFSAAVSSEKRLYVWGEATLAVDTRARTSHEALPPSVAAASGDGETGDGTMADGGAGEERVTFATSVSSTTSVSASEERAAVEADVAVREVRPLKETGKVRAACAGGFHFLMLLDSAGGGGSGHGGDGDAGRGGGSGGGSGGGIGGEQVVVSWGENAAAQLCRSTSEQVAEEAEAVDPPPPIAVAGAPGHVLVGCGSFHSLMAVQTWIEPHHL
jgi:hypothetical protein